MITPPDYAFGEHEMADGLIPPNSTLMFDFAIISVEKPNVAQDDESEVK